MKEHKTEIYYRTKEAAEYCKCGKSTLEKLRITGNGPSYYKLKKAVIYSRDQLDDWVSQNELTSTSDTGGNHDL
ncbi:helix-turn-helix domain-containing protein [Emcibacteraceae bacterium]|jgi:hypothetical protein|nr:helix-turn-helix domain-containing protein [Emcibacteraceae bacterium]